MLRRELLAGAGFLVAVLFLIGDPTARAEVVRVEVTERSEVLSSKSFGSTGPYERLVGRIHFEIDPADEANRRISDIEQAPRNEGGRVEFSADFYALVPGDPTRGNRTVLYEVSNRGRKSLLQRFNLASGSFDPRLPEHFGDGFLLELGYTLIWMGWQFDVPPEPDLLRFFVPAAGGDGEPITGVVRSDYVPDNPIRSFHLADRTHIPYRALESEPITLTVRDCSTCPRTEIPRSRWRLAREVDGRTVPDTAYVFLEEGLEPGRIYEVVYHSKDPKLVGLGLAATRDLVSFLKYGSEGTGGMPLGDLHRTIRHAVGYGSSQSGRFLRTFLYFGFNRDPAGRPVFDGLWPSVAGGGRGSFNHRFAQPSRDARPHFNFFYPTDVFPFTDLPQMDPETGLEEGLLDRTRKQAAVPKIIYTNASYEYFGRSASLIHTTLDGLRDFEPHDNARIYLIAGANHGPGSFPPRQGRQRNPGNINDFRWVFRGLLHGLQAWITEDTEPPPSQYPRISDDTLVTLEKVRFPDIPGQEFPTRIQTAYRVDYGPRFRTERIITVEPPHLGKPFPMRVPQVDADGNETSGIRLPMVRVPLGTHTGWNLRIPEIGAPHELFSMTGSWIPFPKTSEERERTGDPRLSMEERYAGREDYRRRVEAAARELAAAGYVLESDLDGIVEEAVAVWDYYLTD